MIKFLIIMFTVASPEIVNDYVGQYIDLIEEVNENEENKYRAKACQVKILKYKSLLNNTVY